MIIIQKLRKILEGNEESCMTSIREIYVKTFSDIAHLQRAKRISYALIAQKEGYGIRVSSMSYGCGLEETVRNIFETESQARNMLLFLYENGVEPQQLLEILDDIAAQEGDMP